MPKIKTSIATRILTRLLAFAVLWWVIVQGQLDAWIIGLPAAVFATLASISLSSDSLPRLSVIGLVRFIILFIPDAGGLSIRTLISAAKTYES